MSHTPLAFPVLCGGSPATSATRHRASGDSNQVPAHCRSWFGMAFSLATRREAARWSACSDCDSPFSQVRLASRRSAATVSVAPRDRFSSLRPLRSPACAMPAWTPAPPRPRGEQGRAEGEREGGQADPLTEGAGLPGPPQAVHRLRPEVPSGSILDVHRLPAQGGCQAVQSVQEGLQTGSRLLGEEAPMSLLPQEGQRVSVDRGLGWLTRARKAKLGTPVAAPGSLQTLGSPTSPSEG